MDRLLNVAFIAAGDVAGNHHAALRHSGAGRLVTFYEPDAGRAAARSREWGVPAAASADAILADPGIEAVYVLTPYERHFDYCARALQSGKHVLVEKPVSQSATEILELARLARSAGRVCMPSHTTLYIHEVRRIRRALAVGDLGRPVALFLHETYMMPAAKAVRYHGPVREVLIHLVYVLLHLAGRPRRLSAFATHLRADVPGETQVMVNLEFPGGLLGHMYLSWGATDHSADPWTYHVKLLGDRGSASFNRRGVVSGLEEAGNILSPLYQEGFDATNDYFLRRCVAGGEPPLSTLEDAADALAVLAAVQQAAAGAGVADVDYPG